MTYGHLRADCLYTGSAPGPTLGIEYGKPLPLPFTVTKTTITLQLDRQHSIVLFYGENVAEFSTAFSSTVTSRMYECRLSLDLVC